MRRRRRNNSLRVFSTFILLMIILVMLRSCLEGLIHNSSSHDSSGHKLIYKNPTIIVDPGHGGFDGGAIGYNNIIEKDVNLSISLKLKEMLDFLGYEVITTRDGDYSIEDDCTKSMSERKTSDMNNRFKLTEKYENPIFISIHQNKFPQSSCSGAQIFYGRCNNSSKKLANILQKNIKNDINQSNNREIKKGDKNLFLLYNCKCPTILIECGFLSNIKESALLQDPEYQTKLCFVITKSILEFTDRGESKMLSLFSN